MMETNSAPDFSMEGFRDGRLDEFKKVYELYYSSIYLFAFNLIEETQEAQDIVTESFVKLWRLHAKMESLANIKAFLYMTAKNASLDHLRRLQRRKNVYTNMKYIQSDEADDAVMASMIRAEVLGELSHRIEELPDRCQQVFKLIFYKNFSTSEVSKELGISNQNVLNQKAKAVQILRSVFKDYALAIPEIWVLLFLVIR